VGTLPRLPEERLPHCGDYPAQCASTQPIWYSELPHRGEAAACLPMSVAGEVCGRVGLHEEVYVRCMCGEERGREERREEEEYNHRD
jgi:hypothetical protein